MNAPASYGKPPSVFGQRRLPSHPRCHAPGHALETPFGLHHRPAPRGGDLGDLHLFDVAHGGAASAASCAACCGNPPPPLVSAVPQARDEQSPSGRRERARDRLRNGRRPSPRNHTHFVDITDDRAGECSRLRLPTENRSSRTETRDRAPHRWMTKWTRDWRRPDGPRPDMCLRIHRVPGPSTADASATRSPTDTAVRRHRPRHVPIPRKSEGAYLATGKTGRRRTR